MESEKKNPFENLNYMQLMALCIYGEARNQGLDGMLAVASVIMNRVKKQGWMGKTIKEVILKEAQFSCFDEDDPNRSVLAAIALDFQSNAQKDGGLSEAYWVALGVLDYHLASNVDGAVCYFRRLIDLPDPDWASKMRFVRKIGDHLFYA